MLTANSQSFIDSHNATKVAMTKLSLKLSAVALTVSLPCAAGFFSSSRNQPQHEVVSMTAFSEEDMCDEAYKPNNISPPRKYPSQLGKKMSESLPFLRCPPVLQESDLAGNVGFDPLGLAKNHEALWNYREAEVKHARLAMLAAVGWPVSELLDRDIATFFQVPTTLDVGDRVPTVLNGGMNKISPAFWGFCLGLCAAIDVYGVAKARRGGPEYFPGNLGFDPFNFYTDDKLVQDRLKLAEMKHGRIAMLGVLGYVIEEYATKAAVVDDTPIFFQPFTETAEEAVLGILGAEEALEAAVVGSV